MKVITVRFYNPTGSSSDKKYAYLTDFDFKPGDIAVVKVCGEFKCVTVVDTTGIAKCYQDKAEKFIVQKVDTEQYDKLVARGKAINAIRAELRNRKEQAEEMLIYQTLAKSDPVMQDLLAKLGEIDPSAVPEIEGNSGAMLSINNTKAEGESEKTMEAVKDREHNDSPIDVSGGPSV